jgi:hypothetical protein
MTKLCYVCEQNENPFGPEFDNWITIEWFGKNDTDDAHEICWRRES